MARSGASFVRPLMLAVLASACFIEQPPAPITTVIFVEGTVVSDQTNAPIAGALVRLANTGNFSNSPALVTSVTDALGNFKLTDFVQHRPGECGHWVSATSDGYQKPSAAADVVFIECESDVQVVQIRLQPLP